MTATQTTNERTIMATKNYRVYEAYRNAVGGIDGCVTGWDHIEDESAEAAARDFWDDGWSCDESTVIVATDDDGDSAHFYPSDS